MIIQAKPDALTNRQILQQIRAEHLHLLEQIQLLKGTPDRAIVAKYWPDKNPSESLTLLVLENVENNIRFAVDRVDAILGKAKIAKEE